VQLPPDKRGCTAASSPLSTRDRCRLRILALGSQLLNRALLVNEFETGSLMISTRRTLFFEIRIHHSLNFLLKESPPATPLCLYLQFMLAFLTYVNLAQDGIYELFVQDLVHSSISVACSASLAGCCFWCWKHSLDSGN
jgi:uncharacterized membrane protein